MEGLVYLILMLFLAVVPPWVMKYDRKKWFRMPTYAYLLISALFFSIIRMRLKSLDFIAAISIGGALGLVTLWILYWKNKGNNSSSAIIVDEIVQALSFFIIVPSLGLGIGLYNLYPKAVLFLGAGMVYSLTMAGGLLIIKYIYHKDAIWSYDRIPTT